MVNHPNRSKRPKWQPIETAPRDGTAVLGWDGEHITAVEWWSPCDSANKGYWSLVVAGSYAEDDRCDPSHWMPLPDPPTSS